MNMNVPLKKTMRVNDIADLTGLSLTYVYLLTTKPGFPMPDLIVGTVKMWSRAKIERWHKDRKRAQAA